MRNTKGMESLVFSYAYYEVADFKNLMEFFRILHDARLFNIDNCNEKKQKMRGAFIQDYPKNHWNYLGLPGEKQVVGGAEIKEGILKIDAKTKSTLKMLRGLLEKTRKESIRFQKEEFEDITEMLNKTR